MQRLPFRLPEWAPRTIWSSVRAREVWEPRIYRISQVWQQVERLLVIEGIRQSCLQNIAPEDLPTLMQEVGKHGLMVLPLAKTAKANGYQSVTPNLGATDPWDYRCAITHSELAPAWTSAWQTSDNRQIGSLLSYPACCQLFFEKAWVSEKWFDTTWPMVAGGEDQVQVQPGINMLWRWHGLRTVSHLPCSFGCVYSIKNGSDALATMHKHYPQEAAWLKEILSWPVEWSALHGIAEIRTPINRTVVATDATAEKLIVQYMGTGYPEEGASGLTFPHKRVIIKPISRLSNSKDNGFATHAGMQEAHSKLLAALKPPYNTVLDLGCGDGVLLAKIPAKRRIGIESDPRVAQLAEKRLDRVVQGDCTDDALVNRILQEEQPDLIIAQDVRNPITTLTAPAVLSYNYETGHVRLY